MTIKGSLEDPRPLQFKRRAKLCRGITYDYRAECILRAFSCAKKVLDANAVGDVENKDSGHDFLTSF